MLLFILLFNKLNHWTRIQVQEYIFTLSQTYYVTHLYHICPWQSNDILYVRWYEILVKISLSLSSHRYTLYQSIYLSIYIIHKNVFTFSNHYYMQSNKHTFLCTNQHDTNTKNKYKIFLLLYVDIEENIYISKATLIGFALS